jgi:hypothetical protein
MQLESNRAAAERRAIEAEKSIREKQNASRNSLATAERDENARAQHDKMEIAKRHAQPRTQLASDLREFLEVEQKERDLAASNQASLHKEIFSARWRLSEAAGGLSQFQRLSFGNYIKTIVAS